MPMSATNQNGRGASWIQGGTRCATPLPTTGKPWRVVLLGPPGVGKGTQAALLAKHRGVCHLSTGDIFRAARDLPPEHRTPALNAALEYMRRGDLVPDDIVLDLLRERINCLRCPPGFLLDGFPRTVAQAQALEALLAQENLPLNAVLDYELPVEEIVARISGRRTCPNCRAVFHIVASPPRVPDICDHCGSRLVQREDDRPEAVRLRLQVYEERTKPLTDYYQQRGLLIRVPATGTPEEIFQRTLAALDSR
jgi:adenylate kinase